MVLSKAELPDKLHLVEVVSWDAPRGDGQEGPCAGILPRGGFVGHHIWVSLDADGLERAQSHFLGGEILPTYVSICRAPVRSCGAIVSSLSHHLAYPSSRLSAQFMGSVCGACL